MAMICILRFEYVDLGAEIPVWSESFHFLVWQESRNIFPPLLYYLLIPFLQNWAHVQTWPASEGHFQVWMKIRAKTLITVWSKNLKIYTGWGYSNRLLRKGPLSLIYEKSNWKFFLLLKGFCIEFDILSRTGQNIFAHSEWDQNH